MRQLLPPSQKTWAEFVNGQLWDEIKMCLMDRMMEAPDVKDPSHIAAAKGHRQAEFLRVIREIENLAIQNEPEIQNPFLRPAVAIQED